MTLKLPDTGAEVLPDGRRLPASTQRNAAAIQAVLMQHRPSGHLLEIASGSGLHAAQFAPLFPGLIWQSTDLNPENLTSINAWTKEIANVRPAIILDATQPGWHRDFAPCSVLLVNLLHLIPMAAAAVVLNEIALALGPGSVAYIYGPFLRQGQTTSDGDAAFHASLQAQDPAIGYKDLDWVIQHLPGLGCDVIEMPANNVMLIARHIPSVECD